MVDMSKCDENKIHPGTKWFPKRAYKSEYVQRISIFFVFSSLYQSLIHCAQTHTHDRSSTYKSEHSC